MAVKATRAQRIARQHFRLQARHAERLGLKLRRYFKALGARAATRFLRIEAGLQLDGETWRTKAQGPRPTLIVTESDKRILAQLLTAAEAVMWDDSQALVATVLTEVEPVAMPASVQGRIGQRVTQITEATRSQVASTISEGFGSGLSDAQIADELRSVVEETYKGRADTIARTEIATVDAEATVDAYDQVGVTHVIISDGSGCGWRKHKDPDKADGTRRTLAAWRSKPIAHPNCVRSAAPLEPD